MSTALRALGYLLLILLFSFLALQVWYLAHLLHWRGHDPESSRFMRDRLTELRERDPQARLEHRWVPYERISEHIKRAVIASEDANFPAHDGVDWDAIDKAFERNQQRGRVVGGGSTITMQLAKNLFLSAERSYWRKGQEVLIAFMIERLMTKRRILELYLNLAQWGRGTFGIEAAARHYYKLSAAQIGPQQAARLAAMLPRPSYHDQHRDNAGLLRRAASIERWMPAVDPP